MDENRDFTLEKNGFIRTPLKKYRYRSVQRGGFLNCNSPDPYGSQNQDTKTMFQSPLSVAPSCFRRLYWCYEGSRALIRYSPTEKRAKTQKRSWRKDYVKDWQGTIQNSMLHFVWWFTMPTNCLRKCVSRFAAPAWAVSSKYLQKLSLSHFSLSM